MTPRSSAASRLALQVLIVVCGIWWLLYWFLLPIDTAQRWLNKIDRKVNVRFLGTTGSIFMLQGLPVMVIAIATYFVVGLKRRQQLSLSDQEKPRKPRLNIWTLPIFLKSPLGMLTLGDLIFILVTNFVVLWYIIKTSVDASRRIDRNPVPAGLPSRWVTTLRAIGQSTGIASLIPFALLWIPVARGSPLLRVIGVPFEHAVKHHIWLGSLTIWLSAIHTAFLMLYLVHQRDISHILSWRNGTFVACIPAMIAMGAGVLMLATAISAVRRRWFDLFFRMHHLYLVFLIFFGFHAFFEMYILIVPVLLFFLDRFMRMIQSRKAVDVVSAKVLPSGAMELRFAKPESLSYHALSFVYVLLPSVSRFQWHPFSVASSPLDGTNELSIYIKPLGKFTKNLHDTLIASKDCQSKRQGRPQLFKCPFSFKVGLEGPYGDESSFYLEYQTLIMVAGGIGVTPFLAMLRDILHRYRMQPFQNSLPSTIHLIFVCRQAYELDILDSLAPNTILPGYEEHLNIKIQAFVTSKEQVADNSQELQMTEEEKMEKNRSTHIATPMNHMSHSRHAKNMMSPVHEDSKKKEMEDGGALRRVSPFSPSGHTGWVGLTVTSTIVGFFVLWGIFNVTVLDPIKHNWAVILLYILCVFLSVVFVGGGVMVIWSCYERMRNRKLDAKVANSGVMQQHDMNPFHDVMMHSTDEDHEMHAPGNEMHSANEMNSMHSANEMNPMHSANEMNPMHSANEMNPMHSANEMNPMHSHSTHMHSANDMHSHSTHMHSHPTHMHSANEMHSHSTHMHSHATHMHSANEMHSHSTHMHSNDEMQQSRSTNGSRHDYNMQRTLSAHVQSVDDMHSRSTNMQRNQSTTMQRTLSANTINMQRTLSAHIHSTRDMNVDVEGVTGGTDGTMWRGNLVSGKRPNWKDMFDTVAAEFAGQDVGVVVSGSSFMQTDVARECKRHSLTRDSNIMMHYHSVSFEF